MRHSRALRRSLLVAAAFATGCSPAAVAADPAEREWKIVHESGVHATHGRRILLQQEQSGFRWTPVVPRVGEEVEFVAGAAEFVVAWGWSFGDGSSTTEDRPTTRHNYFEPGAYEVTLTMVGSIGALLPITRTVIVNDVPAIGSPSEFAYVVPAVARSEGVHDTSWVSDVVLNNPGTLDAAANVYLCLQGQDNGSAHGIRVAVGAGESVILADVVGDGFGLFSAVGMLVITSSSRLGVNSRTYNDSEDGTFGQLVAGVRASSALSGDTAARLIQLTDNDSYRTNLGLANATGEPITVHVDLFTADGALVGNTDYDIQPFGHHQHNGALADLASEDIDDGYLVVSSPAEGARFFAYASVVDNRSGDPILVVPTTIEASRGVAESGSLKTLQDCPSPAGVMDFGVLNRRPADVVMVGDFLYAADAVGLSVYDLSDPSQPTLVGTAVLGGEGAAGVDVVSDLAVLAGGWDGVYVVDVSDPTAPEILGSVKTIHWAWDVAMSGTVALVADGSGGLVVVDLADPSEPVSVSALDIGGYAWEVVVDGDTAFIEISRDGVIAVVDFTDPRNPTNLPSLTSAGTGWKSLAASQSLLCVADEEAGLLIFDVQDPSQLQLLGSLPTDHPDGISMTGSLVYIASRNSGLSAVDISEPSSPLVLGAAATIGGVVAVEGDTLVIASGFDGRFEVVDVEDPADPQVVGGFTTPGLAWEAAVDGHIALVANHSARLMVVDVSDPYQPEVLTRVWTPDKVYQVAISGSVGVACDSQQLSVIDLADPGSPAIVGSLSPSCYDVAIDGDHGYVVDGSHLRIIDLSEPGQPTEVGSLQIEAAAGVAVSGPVVAVVRLQVEGGGIRFVDTADVSNPTLVSSLDISARDVAISGSMAYVTGEVDGLRVIDVSDPRSPQILGSVATPYGIGFSVEASNGRAWVAGGWAGLVEIDATDPMAPRISAAVDTLQFASNVAVSPRADTAWVASAGFGGGIVEGVILCGRVTAPEARFEWSPQQPRVGEPVQFLDTSAGSPDSWLWDFGDGSQTVAVRDPSHVFAIAGPHTVVLTVSNAAGSDSTTQMVSVRDAGEVVAHYVPGAAALTGSASTNWRTDLEVHNHGLSQADFDLELFERDSTNLDPTVESFSLASGTSVRYGDVLGSVFGFAGAATVRVASSGSLAITSRTYNDQPLGTYGQFIAGVDEGEAIRVGERARLIQLSQSSAGDGYRTNLGLVNTTAAGLTVQIDLYSSQGELLGTVEEELPGYGYEQIDRVFARVTASDVANGYSVLSTSTPGGAFLAYASVIDNRSGDPIYVAAVREE